ncbi:MAG: DUF2909 domain-containing protein [Proteobacteria bacterium]|nr:MAG: DUF2909 domain-containing protein [Pseudomonadota bacterium]
MYRMLNLKPRTMLQTTLMPRVFLMKDKGASNRTVHALAFRVGFSIALFVLLLIAYRLGYIQPTGIGLR